MMTPSKTCSVWALGVCMAVVVTLPVASGEFSGTSLGSFTLHRAYSIGTSPLLTTVMAADEQAEAADSPSPASSDDGSTSPWSIRAGIGFTLDPTTFLLTLEAPYALTDSIRVGPLLQFGVNDDRVILAPSANVQYVFDLSEMDDGLKKLKPFVQGGIGFAYFHKDHRRGDNDDVGFLLNLGFGLEYFLTDQFALGSNLLFNILPVDALGDHFFFSWQFLTVSHRF